MKSLILLSGPVGAGKTTVSKELIALSPAPVAYIEGDTFWTFIAKLDRKHVVDSNFRMIMRAMVAAGIPYTLNGFETIVDFSIPPWFLPTAIKMANFREIPLEYVVIRPSLEVCKQRAAERTEGRITDYANYKDLYTSFDEAEKHIISDDDGDAVSLSKRIREGLDAGIFRVG